MKTKLVIFGITGDLSVRKLLPSIRELYKNGLTGNLEIIGVSRRQVDIDGLLARSGGDGGLGALTSVFTMDLSNGSDYLRLKEHVNLAGDEQALIYLAVPPSAATQIVDFLGEAGLNSPNVKLLFEKPFGVDYASAQDMIDRTERYFNDEQIYRIDHYLAKEMAQNLVTFRSNNALFKEVWHGGAIESIEIVAKESLGIEGRAQFYEQTGALRDVLQGHLMQLLALTIMPIPDEFTWSQLPELRLQALESLRPARPEEAYRAQYDGYQQEADNPGSLTETFTYVSLSSKHQAWQNVIFKLATGKALDQKVTEVRVVFRNQGAQPNRLVFRIQPDEAIELDLVTKRPGYEKEVENRRLVLNYAPSVADAYEQVLLEAMRADKSLFASGKEVLAGWRVLQPLLDKWAMDDAELPVYAKGSRIQDIVA